MTDGDRLTKGHKENEGLTADFADERGFNWMGPVIGRGYTVYGNGVNRICQGRRKRTSSAFRAARVCSSGNSGSLLVSWAASSWARKRSYSRW